MQQDDGHHSKASAGAGIDAGRFVAGVTGHRPGRLEHANITLLQTRVHEVLEALSHVAGDRQVMVLSSLAEGADQIVARQALAAGYTLECPLPFARDEYAHDFANIAARAEYFALLSQATLVIELDGSHETPEHADVAYAAAGAFMVASADVMLAIWDGEDARGHGGTGHVVQMALDAGDPVIWINASAPHDISILSPASCDDMAGQPLECLTDVLRLRR